MNDKYFVIAGNHQQYRDFVKRKAQQLYDEGQTSVTLSNFIYVSGPENLLGYANPRGFFVGTWRERKDMDYIFHQLTNHTGLGTPSRQVFQRLWNEWIKIQNERTN